MLLKQLKNYKKNIVIKNSKRYKMFSKMLKGTHRYPEECLRLKIITDSKYMYSV